MTLAARHCRVVWFMGWMTFLDSSFSSRRSHAVCWKALVLSKWVPHEISRFMMSGWPLDAAMWRGLMEEIRLMLSLVWINIFSTLFFLSLFVDREGFTRLLYFSIMLLLINKMTSENSSRIGEGQQTVRAGTREKENCQQTNLLSSSSRLLTSAPHSRRMEATVREGNLQTG